MPAKTHEEKVRNNRLLVIDAAIRSLRYPSLGELAKKAEGEKGTKRGILTVITADT
jgi:hypothetical protein